jgi:hypothetical protein
MKIRKINLGWENKEPIAISAYAKKILREKIPYHVVKPLEHIQITFTLNNKDF